jgi:hypothetical protein
MKEGEDRAALAARHALVYLSVAGAAVGYAPKE